ncbi:MAG: hypothetical protein P0107_04655 [Nitrosomonas sp.]|nr:hypothetical protein [Nitrosomonas sp.]
MSCHFSDFLLPPKFDINFTDDPTRTSSHASNRTEHPSDTGGIPRSGSPQAVHLPGTGESQQMPDRRLLTADRIQSGKSAQWQRTTADVNGKSG